MGLPLRAVLAGVAMGVSDAVGDRLHVQPLVSTLLLNRHADVVEATDPDAMPLALFPAGERVCEALKLLVAEIYLEAGQ